MGVIVRPLTEADLEALIDVQQHGAVLAISHIFPQHQYPFPRETILDRWRDEIGDPTVQPYIAVDQDGATLGFAATRGAELLHFGTAVATWGSQVARELHDAVIVPMMNRGVRPILYVFDENHRARRFYEKLGWQATGASRTGDFPPHPLLVEYALEAPT